MVEIGRYNRLEIIKERSVGYFFDGGDAGDILMPARHQPEHCEVGDWLKVFVFHDAEGRLTATVRIPYAQVGECAYLEVVETLRSGAFLDWGMTKDLLVPLREQKELLLKGNKYLVKLLLDHNQRIIGTTRLEEHIQAKVEPETYQKGQQVDIIIAEHIDLGYRAIVEHKYWGLLYHNETFKTLRIGQKLKAYIQRVRDDLRLDLSVKKPGYHRDQVGELGETILRALRQNDGVLDIGDKSEPEEIKKRFGVSKKAFKQALGLLYKKQLVSLTPDKVILVPKALQPHYPSNQRVAKPPKPGKRKKVENAELARQTGESSQPSQRGKSKQSKPKEAKPVKAQNSSPWKKSAAALAKKKPKKANKSNSSED